MADDIAALFLPRPEGGELELTRHFRHPVEKLWAALTIPHRLADWMGVEWLGGDAPLREGAEMDYRFKNTSIESRGRVLRCDAPHVLEHSWFENLPPASVVRWTLAPEGQGCRLTLTHNFGQPDDAPRTAAGWAQILDNLAAALSEGALAESKPGWRERRDQYALAFPPQASRDGRLAIDGAVKLLTFHRSLAHPPQAIWAALTQPAVLAKWMQADAVVDGHKGGRFELKFDNFDHAMRGEVVIWDPPYVLEITWPENAANGDSRVRFEVAPDGAGSRLTLTHTLRAGGNAADFASGWHWHLDSLDAALLGEARFFQQQRWAALKQIYESTL